MRTSWFLRLILVLLCVFLISACVSGAGKHNATPVPVSEKTPLVIAVDAWTGFMPVVLAKEKGFFDEEGVNVEYRFNESSRQQRLEFEAGAYDGITLALGSLIAVSAKAPDTRVVLLTDISTTGDAVVVRPEIKSIADLKGKRIVLGAAGYGEVVVNTMLQQAGLTGEDVIWVSMQNEAEAMEMLKDGRVDAFQTWEPFISRSVAEGAHIIFTGADVPGLIPDAIGFHGRVLEERPEDVKAFLRGWFHAVDFWLANPAEATQVISKAVGLAPAELSLETMEMLTLARNKEFFQKGEDFSSVYYAARVYMDFFIRKGVLSKSIDLDEYINASFINALP
jgi:NitT/TauT family transport system substrate-binding protein